jgi:putative restriction endonuclease
MMPYIANTDPRWYAFLMDCAAASGGRLDEVNFWSPRSTRPLKADMPLGTPVFFRLKSPHQAVAGYGFFAHHHLVSLDDAWTLFGLKNGDPDRVGFLRRIGEYRGLDLLDPRQTREPIGCTILRDARFWPRERWIPWRAEEGWASAIIQGKTEQDPVRANRLLAEITVDAQPVPEDLQDVFVPLDVDERQVALQESVVREGQGAFRLRLLDAYGGRCAITGEHTEPVLDAAHIQPYLGPRSNHVQNGLVLTKEFHTLFDLGYVGVTPDLIVRVSPKLRERWQNGKRYYPCDGQRLVVVPSGSALRPSAAALDWHIKHRFGRVA